MVVNEKKFIKFFTISLLTPYIIFFVYNYFERAKYLPLERRAKSELIERGSAIDNFANSTTDSLNVNIKGNNDSGVIVDNDYPVLSIRKKESISHKIHISNVNVFLPDMKKNRPIMSDKNLINSGDKLQEGYSGSFPIKFSPKWYGKKLPIKVKISLMILKKSKVESNYAGGFTIKYTPSGLEDEESTILHLPLHPDAVQINTDYKKLEEKVNSNMNKPKERNKKIFFISVIFIPLIYWSLFYFIKYTKKGNSLREILITVFLFISVYQWLFYQLLGHPMGLLMIPIAGIFIVLGSAIWIFVFISLLNLIVFILSKIFNKPNLTKNLDWMIEGNK